MASASNFSYTFSDNPSCVTFDGGSACKDTSYYKWSDWTKETLAVGNGEVHTQSSQGATTSQSQDFTYLSMTTAMYSSDWWSLTTDVYSGSYTDGDRVVKFKDTFTQSSKGTNYDNSVSKPCEKGPDNCVLGFYGGITNETDWGTSTSSTFDIFGSLVGSSTNSWWEIRPTVTVGPTSFKYEYNPNPPSVGVTGFAATTGQAATPEPGTVMMLLGGIGLLGIKRKMRRA